MRHIAVFTSTRADYDLLRPVLLELQTSKDVFFTVIVSGTHLLTEYGHTAEAIYSDRFSHVDVPLFRDEKNTFSLSSIMSRGIEIYGEVLKKLYPDIALVLGDRYETFCFSTSAVTLHIPLAHIHGGELTLGCMDDIFRHCITKMSLLHFTSCEEYRTRVIQLGESPERVWNFGALGVQNALNLPFPSREYIINMLGIPPGCPFLLCTLHPVTMLPGLSLSLVYALLDALDVFTEYNVVFTGSNADPEGKEITSLLQENVRCYPGQRYFFSSLGTLLYLGLAKYSSAVIGNSSSGVIEIPSLGVPVVDIGIRQTGRLRSEAVIHCEPTTEAICTALRLALSNQGSQRAMTASNPYEGKNTAKHITEVLCTYPLYSGIKKIFFDVVKGQ